MAIFRSGRLACTPVSFCIVRRAKGQVTVATGACDWILHASARDIDNDNDDDHVDDGNEYDALTWLLLWW